MIFARRAVVLLHVFLASVVACSITTLSTPNESARGAEPSSKTQTESTSLSGLSCDELLAQYQNELEKLAEKCDELKMPLEAKVTRSLIYQEKPYYFVVPLLPNEIGASSLPEDATKTQRQWFAKLRSLQKQYSDATFAVAEQLGKKKKGYDVVACVLTTLFINPDHVKARRFFGYSAKAGRWRTKWQLQQLEKGLVETPEFGWLPEDRVERYESGERFYRNKWVTADEEFDQILAGSSGWRVETDHFSILSRVSLERGVEIGRFLESYYQVWSRLFYRFIASETQWNSRLYNDSEIVAKRHKVILYRNRSEYLRELKKYDSNILQSNGGYFPSLHCIFVYEPEEDEFDLLSLLAHEATHQLFDECNATSGSRNKTAFSNRARLANFWAIEGVAVYAETFRLNEKRTSATLGGYKDAFRVQCAMESLIEDKTYMPLREYAGLSRRGFQERRDLSTLYSQAAGLTFFFMHYADGIYRDPFVVYLYWIYQGVDEPNSLPDATGKSFKELDAEYEEFMKSLYQQVSQR